MCVCVREREREREREWGGVEGSIRLLKDNEVVGGTVFSRGKILTEPAPFKLFSPCKSYGGPVIVITYHLIRHRHA